MEFSFSPHYKNIKFVYTTSRFVQYFSYTILCVRMRALVFYFSVLSSSFSLFGSFTVLSSLLFLSCAAFFFGVLCAPVSPSIILCSKQIRRKITNSQPLQQLEGKAKKGKTCNTFHANRPSNFVHLRSHACLLNYHTKH